MLFVIEAVVPIFWVIMLGYCIKNYLIKEDNFWSNLNRLTYWVLLPAFLFYHTSLAELTTDLVKDILIVLCVSAITVAVLTIIVCKRYYSPSDLSSILQGGCRHNTFIAFILSDLLYGQQGLYYAAASTAILVPFTNIFVIFIMTLILKEGKSDTLLDKRDRLLKESLTNPFLLSIFLGFIFNFLDLGKIFIFHDTLQLLGRSGLTIMLLCIGSSLVLSYITSSLRVVMISMLYKYIVFPICVFIIGFMVALPKEAFLVAIIFSCVPTATASYALASQMGGNRYLMANIISAQTLLCLFSIPITLVLGEYILDISGLYD